MQSNWCGTVTVGIFDQRHAAGMTGLDATATSAPPAATACMF
jgi:hypothetical protein